MSGDSRTDDYDEVGAMRGAAIAAGVPAEAIVIDPAGLSTYDSIVRLAEVYGGRRVVIVTQSYHLYRALYLAEKLGLDAYGVSADLRSYAGQGKREVREVLARCKDVVYALKRPPATTLPTDPLPVS
jgi:vancomycin permeability regulator SanA